MNKKNIFLLSLILFISFSLRFYRLGDIYVFNFDEEYQSTYAWTEVLHPHLIWIGVSTSFLDFYLGPYFTYFTAIVLAASHGDPIMSAYLASLVGVITTIIVFLIGWRFFNLITGVVASSLYATLPIFVFFDQKYWNAMFIVSITLLSFFVVNIAKRSKWWWVLYAGLIGAVFNTQLAPFPILLIGVWYFLKDKYWKDIKLVLICFLVFLLAYWPLVVFDLNHNFSNLLALTRITNSIDQSKIRFDPGTKIKSLFDSMGRFWYLTSGNPNADEINFSCNPLTVKSEFKNVGQYVKRTNALFYLSLLSLILVYYYIWTNRNSRKESHKLLSIFLSVGIFSFLVYPGGSSEYYTLSILVLLTFVPGILLSQIDKKMATVLFGVVTIFSLLGINTVLNTSDEFSLGPKKVLIAEVMKVVGQDSFAIEGRGICHNYEGWRYLFKVYGRVPSQSYTDDNLGWLYPNEIGKEKPAFTVILAEDRIPLKEDLSNLPSIKAGGYRAYIRKNK